MITGGKHEGDDLDIEGLKANADDQIQKTMHGLFDGIIGDRKLVISYK